MRLFLFLLLVFILSYLQVNAQCTASHSVDTVYGAPGTYSMPAGAGPITTQLCPGVTAYDTSNWSTNTYYLRPGSTLYLRTNFGFSVYMQGNSAVLDYGGNGTLAYIYKEAQSTVVGNFTGTQTVCASVNFPAASCNLPQDIEEHFSENDCYISPNPASNEIQINFNEESDYKKFRRVEIINNIGQLIKEEDFNCFDKRAFLNISGLPEGVYVLRLKGGKIINSRFIIAR